MNVFLSSANFFQNQFLKKILSGTLSVSNSLDSDQVRHVWPDLGPNCFKDYQQMTLVSKELIYSPGHKILVLIILVSSKGSGELAHFFMCRLFRAFTACSLTFTKS